MTPKLVNWVGTAIILAILLIVNISALYNIISGKPEVRAEIITVVVSGVAILIAVLLKLISSKRR